MGEQKMRWRRSALGSHEGDREVRWGCDHRRGETGSAGARARRGTVPMELRSVARHVVAFAIVLTAAVAAHAQPAQSTPLRNLVDDQVGAKIGYCRGEYILTMGSSTQHRYPEFNLRFKTDGSRLRPDPGKPALLPAGMRGDRAQVIFAGLDDLKRFLVEQC